MPTDLFGPYRLDEKYVATIRKKFKGANTALEKLIETLKDLQKAFADAHLGELEQQMQNLIDQTVDVLPKNEATLILRSMICEKLSEATKQIIGQTCKAVRNVAHTVRDFDADVAKQRINALAALVGLKDEEEPKAD